MTYTDPGYFEALYQTDADPWKFATSDYEREKYAATIAALPDGQFTRGFEVGCSIGVLTRQLAARCGKLLAVDVSETALTQARDRCADLSQVSFATMGVPAAWPMGTFDLIVLSEVLYYLGIDGIQEAAKLTLSSLAPGGTVMLVNWHGVTDGACTGDKAATLFIAAVAGVLSVHSAERAEKYRVDVLRA